LNGREFGKPKPYKYIRAEQKAWEERQGGWILSPPNPIAVQVGRN